MSRIFPFFLILFFALSLRAQSVQITQHDLSAYFSSTNFLKYAEAGNGDIWLLYSYLANGTSNFEMAIYDGMSWDTLHSPVCPPCVRDIAAGPAGKIWIAGSDEGIWRRDDSVWTQVLPDAALKLSFDDQDNLVFLNGSGVSVYDGMTVTPGLNAAAPNIPFVNKALFDQDGLLWILLPGKLYTYDSTTGWVEKTDVSSPLYIDLRSDNRLYITDSFGYVNYYENGAYTVNSITGVYPAGFGFTAFAIDGADVFWSGIQGINAGVVRYDGSSDTLIAETDLTVNGILISEIFVASNNDKWVASRSSSTVAKIVDSAPSTGIYSPELASFSFQLQPNPTQGLAMLSFSLERPSAVTVEISTLSGSLVQRMEQPSASGSQEVSLAVSGLSAGMYLVRVQTDSEVGVKKLLVE